MGNKIGSNELLHYGVLGMRWGVRRFQPYPSNYKGQGKEVGEAKRKTQRIGWDDDVLVKKGTKAYRISKEKTDTNDHRYVTIDENDRNFYKGMWPSVMKNRAGTANRESTLYEHTYKIKEDLISPSAAKRQKMAAELADTKEGKAAIIESRIVGSISRQCEVDIRTAKSYIARWFANDDKDFKKFYIKTADEILNSIDKSDERGKAKYAMGAMGYSDRMKTLFGEKVVKAGYNMVIDDHGADFAGKSQRVNAPVIILKANQILDQVKSKPVSDIQADIAMSKYMSDISTISGKSSQKNYVPNVLKEAYGTKNYYENDTFKYIYNDKNERIG